MVFILSLVRLTIWADDDEKISPVKWFQYIEIGVISVSAMGMSNPSKKISNPTNQCFSSVCSQKKEGQARQSTMLYGGGSTRFPGGNTNNRVAAAPVSKILNSARFGRGSFHIIIILIILLTMIPFIMSPTWAGCVAS